MNALRLTQIATAAYVAVGLVTFGHAASAAYRNATAFAAKCAATPKCVLLAEPAEGATYVGIISGVAWPLYWSWELQQ